MGVEINLFGCGSDGTKNGFSLPIDFFNVDVFIPLRPPFFSSPLFFDLQLTCIHERRETPKDEKQYLNPTLNLPLVI